MTVIVNTRTGETGDHAVWVAEFAEAWRGGCSRVDRFMDLMSPDIRLIAPGLKPTSGRDAGERAFRHMFDVLPDLTAEVQRWSAAGDALFIEMTFHATIGGRPTRWPNVDRFLFRDGYAVERVAYFNPLRVRRAFLRTPSGWLQLMRRLRHSA